MHMWLDKKWVKGLQITQKGICSLHEISNEKRKQFVLKPSFARTENGLKELEKCRSLWENAQITSVEDILLHEHSSLLASSSVRQHWVWGLKNNIWSLHFIAHEQKKQWNLPSDQEWTNFLYHHQFEQVLIISNSGKKWDKFSYEDVKDHWEIQKMMIVTNTSILDHWVLGKGNMYLSERKNNYILEN